MTPTMDVETMDDSPTDRADGRRRTVAGVAAMAVSMPATVMAAPMDATPAVAFYTVSAVGIVLVLAVVAGLALRIAEGLEIVGSERRVRVRRRLRIAFGAVFLLAAITPYVALNFSAGALIPFVGVAALIIAGWVWGASQNERGDSEMSQS